MNSASGRENIFLPKNNMPDERRIFGTRGESRAAVFLRQKGMQIIGSQVRTPYGEIDLVCLDGGEVVFVEVKTRRTEGYGYPEEAITPAKFRHMARAAEAYLAEKKWEHRPFRLDVVALQELEGKDPEIVHFSSIDSASGC